MASWKTADRPLHSGSAEVSAELQDRIQAIKVPPPVQEPADIIFPADNQHRVVEAHVTHMELLCLMVLTNNIRPDSKSTITELQDG